MPLCYQAGLLQFTVCPGVRKTFVKFAVCPGVHMELECQGRMPEPGQLPASGLLVVQGSCHGQGCCLMAFPLSSGGPGTRHDSHSRRSGRTSTGRPARVIALFGALSGDSESGSGRRFCGIWMSKGVSGNAAKQCEGPGTREDCQKAVQEAWEDVNRVPNTC